MSTAKVSRLTKRQFAQLETAAECLKALAHPHRLRIVQLLLAGGRPSVNDLAAACKIAQPMMSEHLRLMHRCGFLAKKKAGRTVYYSIAEPHLAEMMACIENKFGV